jgi:hypothetical protein
MRISRIVIAPPKQGLYSLVESDEAYGSYEKKH